MSEGNLEFLVDQVNEEMRGSRELLSSQIHSIESEMDDTTGRLAKLYDALETGKQDTDHLAPRIKESRVLQNKLKETRRGLESKCATHIVQQVDVGMVKAFARQLMEAWDSGDPGLPVADAI